MKSIKIHVEGAKAVVREAPVLTAGMVGLPVLFTFDESWDGLVRNVVFQAGDVARTKRNIDITAKVDPEVMMQVNAELRIGVVGYSENDEEVIPTAWVAVGHILESANGAFEESVQPEHPVWKEALQKIGKIGDMIREQLQEAKESGEFDGPPGVSGDKALYYGSLTDAVSDLNAGSTERSLLEPFAAAAKVLDSEDGRKKLVLLADVTCTGIKITADVDLVLNGMTITMAGASDVIEIAGGTSCTIDGRVSGSAILKDCTSTTSTTVKLVVSNGNLTLQGGTYRVNATTPAAIITLDGRAGSGEMVVDGCVVEAHNRNTTTTKAVKPFQFQGALLRVQNSQLAATGNCVQTIFTSGPCQIDISEINAEAIISAQGVASTGTPDIKITGTKISAKVSGLTSASIGYGVKMTAGSTLTMENSEIVADAPGDNTSEAYAIGILNDGTAIIKNAEIFGTHSGIENHSKLYVDGGMYTGFSHGGFYFANGAAGLAYITDAVIRCGNYEGVYADIFAGDTVTIYGGFYVGGGTAANNSNVTVHLDGCTIGIPGHKPFIIRGTDGETNNTVNISNSTIVEGAAQIRVDSGTGHRLNVGVGTNITPEGIEIPDMATFTNGFYRKKHPDAECSGRDFDALLSFLTIKTN